MYLLRRNDFIDHFSIRQANELQELMSRVFTSKRINSASKLPPLKIGLHEDVLSHAGSKALGIEWIEVNQTVYRQNSRKKSVDRFYAGVFNGNAIFAMEDDSCYRLYDKDEFLEELKVPGNEQLCYRILVSVYDTTTDDPESSDSFTKSSFF